MTINLTEDEVKALITLIEYENDFGLFDYLSPEEEIEKSRILNILSLLKRG